MLSFCAPVSVLLDTFVCHLAYKWRNYCPTYHWNCAPDILRCPSKHAISSAVRVPVELAVRMYRPVDDICMTCWGRQPIVLKPTLVITNSLLFLTEANLLFTHICLHY